MFWVFYAGCIYYFKIVRGDKIKHSGEKNFATWASKFSYKEKSINGCCKHVYSIIHHYPSNSFGPCGLGKIRAFFLLKMIFLTLASLPWQTMLRSRTSTKREQVGFPLLFVVMVALASIFLGFLSHPWIWSITEYI